MKIIGIDPGLNNLGWAILEQNKNGTISYIRSGRICPKTTDHITVRLANLQTQISEIITQNTPDMAAIEEVFVNINPSSSMVLSFARGAILASLGLHNIRTLEFAPNTIKKTIVGNGKADKEQVMKMLKLVIPSVQFSSKDEADAIAIAYTGLVSYRPY